MTVYPDSNRLDLSDLSLPLLYLFLSFYIFFSLQIPAVISWFYPLSPDYTRYQQIIPGINRLFPLSTDYTRYHLTIPGINRLYPVSPDYLRHPHVFRFQFRFQCFSPWISALNFQ